ncbi:glycosyltransferase family 2 protein [Leptotrichia sp. oral taxon 221]|uniref:glycosyltransferase family 2 protein n=1 Tax=Leptotrichia sp. oral taxon 221 TaxID=712362 RepID=UPI001B8B04BF|nr:glycosyltransferase family 2 protein [Leptotrichia sp. oral taxon 221]QUB97157.1 glycosyltransferase family 2 protein [Leptotrichia sp. oral taxon 221]
MENPKLCILLASYNGEKYISEQLDSIINQTYKNWELIIRDDGSKDETVTILNKYEKKDERIKILRDDKGNLGFLKNFEELLFNAKEEFVLFSDQDDFWLKNKLEKFVEKIRDLDEKVLSKPLLIHCNSLVCDDKLEIIKEEFIDSKIAKKTNSNIYFFEYIVQGSTSMVNKKMIKESLPFLKNVTLHDRYFHLLSQFLGTRVFIDESLVKYRQHERNEIGANRSIIKNIMSKKYFYVEDRKLIEEIKEKYIKCLRKRDLNDIEKYLEVTDRNKNRLERFWLSKYFQMKLLKRLVLLIKG